MEDAESIGDGDEVPTAAELVVRSARHALVVLKCHPGPCSVLTHTGPTIGMQELHMAVQQCSTLQSENAELRADFDALRMLHDGLLETHGQTQLQLEQLALEKVFCFIKYFHMHVVLSI